MRKADPIAKGIEAQQALENPVIKQSFDAIERELVNALCLITMTGPETDALALEKVRELQANRRAQRKLWEMVSHGKLTSEREKRKR